ncbi:MAG: hypothetical protein GY835_00145, partial [bacterium]|nr:hypothetical protein [bacterium]
MKRILSLSLCFVLVTFLASAVMARTLPENEFNFSDTRESVVKAANTSVRADTVFLFPASGPGSYGSEGTYNRGFNFDGAGGTADAAGWTAYDNTAQDGEWWHVESTTLNAGHATDMSAVTPFGGGNNQYALWCGRTAVCGWAIPNGYGDNWEQYVVLDCGSWTETAQVQFQFRSDYEADDCDWFQVVVEV